jgi:hypothetical protein
MMQEQLAKCYKDSGVNFVTDCKELAQKYMEHVKGIGFSRANVKPTDKVSWS